MIVSKEIVLKEENVIVEIVKDENDVLNLKRKIVIEKNGQKIKSFRGVNSVFVYKEDYIGKIREGILKAKRVKLVEKENGLELYVYL